MNRLTRYLARRWWTWYPFMVLMTPVILVLFAFHVLMDTLHHWYAMWHWQWGAEIGRFFVGYKQSTRKGLNSLGAKPQAGGVVWVQPMPERQQ